MYKRINKESSLITNNIKISGYGEINLEACTKASKNY